LNLWIQDVDVTSFSQKKLRELFQDRIPQDLPVLAIWYPEQMGKAQPVWTAKLAPDLVKSLAYSPMRQELAKSLINGESIVWIFVPSGNRAKDEPARALLQRELDTALAAAAKMPYYVMSGSNTKKLTYGFPIRTLSRDDPEERRFLELLMRSEPDLYEYEDEPMVFPVYGRGRLLGCLFGDYITAEKIQNIVAFLAGSCSCEVKALSPGVDLLMAAPWDLVVINSYVDETPLPELTGVMPDAPAAPEASPAMETAAAVSFEPLVTTDREEPRRGKSILFTYGIALSGVVVVVAFASLIIQRRRRD
jgi:hypothetical protein